jgi:hypothetical protein
MKWPTFNMKITANNFNLRNEMYTFLIDFPKYFPNLNPRILAESG